jgi:hypothetical protein
MDTVQETPSERAYAMSRGSTTMRLCSVLAGAALGLTTGATASFAEEAKAQQGTAEQQPPEKHHSKAKGALVGGAGGAVVGGKKGAAVGAAGGALYQHHKNKKAEKKQAKQEKQQDKQDKQQEK